MALTIGHGSTFILNDVPLSAVTVAGVTSVEFGGSKADALDSTDFGTTGNRRTKIGGLVDEGDVTVKFNWKTGDTTQTAFLAYFDGTVHDFKVEYPGGSVTETFSGIVTAFDKNIADDSFPIATVKIAVSGEKTIA
jgi:predicted secreted protein